MACRGVSMSVSMYLCEISDLDVHIADSNGNTALHLAVWCWKNDNTPLHMACVLGDVAEVLRLVYVRGHKVNVQNNYGNTPLHRACSIGHYNIVEILMFAGADETITNDGGKTPAEFAERSGHSELLKLLDRNSLWQMMLRKRKKLKMSFLLLMKVIILTLRLIRRVR